MVETRIAARDFLLPPGGGTLFACWTPGGLELEISVAYKIEEPVPPNALACTFELSCPVEPEELVGTGISMSDLIGPYSYIRTPQADGRGRLRIRVPEGADLLRVGVRRWASAGPTLIRSLTIDQHQGE